MIRSCLRARSGATTDCDAVEGEPKTTMDEFALFFSVPGTVDNEADDAATSAAESYTYRCKGGEEIFGVLQRDHRVAAVKAPTLTGPRASLTLSG